jgi:acetate kinase
MPGRVLIVNAGSSSVKLSVLDDEDNLVASEQVAPPGGEMDQGSLKTVIEGTVPIDAVGHRIVHGGAEFTAPVLIDDGVVRRLEALTDLAPLHQPKSLQALREVSALLPGTPAVACFDTAFHATLPPAAATYALPAEWRQRWELRRFGFHGLSHSYASRRAGQLMGLAGGTGGPLRLVTCHLGAGASLAAVRDGRSVDTTMGFTPLEGLVMASRSGTVDPGLLVWVQQHGGLSASEVSVALDQRSGLLGLAGTADMRQVLSAEARGDPGAVLAMAVFLHRLRAGIAAMVAALDGLDGLVFTGGIGERSSAVRWRAAEGLRFLGVELDELANETAQGDQELTGAGARARTFVVEAREDKEIARGVRQVLGRAPA